MIPGLRPDLARAVAEGARVVEVCADDAAAEPAADAPGSSAWPEDVIVERLTASELGTLRRGPAGTHAVIIHRAEGGADGSDWRVMGSVIEAAPRALIDTGALVLSFPAPSRPRPPAVDAGTADEGSDPDPSLAATIGRWLDRAGLRAQRWLLAYPSHRDPGVLIDERLLAVPDGPELARALVRSADDAAERATSTHPLAALTPPGADVDPTVPVSRVVLAGRADTPAGDGDRDGWLWTLPEACRAHPWRSGWMLVRADAEEGWMLVPRGDTREVVSGPLRFKPEPIVIAAGRNAEDLIVDAVHAHGAVSTQAREALSAWWRAGRDLLGPRSPEGLPIDVGPHRFIVSRDGRWRFLGDGLYHRFGLPAESLAYGAVVRMIRRRRRALGLPTGLPATVSTGRAARLLLEAIDVVVGDEHVALWQELEVDLSVRTRAGVDPAANRRRVRVLDDEPLWRHLLESPPERRPDALRDGRLASLASELGEAVVRLRTDAQRERRRLEQQRAAAETARDEVLARSRRIRLAVERQDEETWDRLEAMRQDARRKDALVTGLRQELTWRDWQIAWHRALPARLEQGPDGRSLMDEERDLVAGSDLVDASWYLQRYTDVAEAGIDPGFHYVRHGAVEGRDPGPAFDTRAYVVEHPEIVAEGTNPLVHALRRRAAPLVAIPIQARSLSEVGT